MIKFAAVLAVVVLAGMLASPASADHKGTCHGQGCDGAGVLEPLVVVDANDQVVGQVMASFLEGVHVGRTDDGVSYPLIVFRDAIQGFLNPR